MAKEVVKDVYRDLPQYPNKKLRLSLPIAPSINHMYVNTRGGGKRLTSKAERYVRDSRALINLEIEEQRWVKQSKAVWYYIDLVFFMPDRRIRDSHNCIKLLMDVMQELIFENDYYVMPRIQSVEYDVDNPRIEICIYPQSRNARDKALSLASC